MLNSVSILIQVCERASRVSQLPSYNIDNLIRKQCYHYRIFSENGRHKYEFVGTEWLNPQGDSVTHFSARFA